MDKPKNLQEISIILLKKLTEVYWKPLHDYVVKNVDLESTFTSLLLNPDKLILYFGKTHLALEYVGQIHSDNISEARKITLQPYDLSLSDSNFLEQIIGFRFDGKMSMPTPHFMEDLVMPTNKGFDKLMKLGWNFEAQNAIVAFNAGNIVLEKGTFYRQVNSFYFDSDDKDLITRHIKWIDFIPLVFDDSDSEHDRFIIDLDYYTKLIERDAHYCYPLPHNEDYKFSKLPQINRFIELIGNTSNSETDITTFLEKSENKFILSMAFLARDTFPQISCEWQSENKNAIIPDFFVLQSNGYANIVEFKLPFLKTRTVTGITNRESFSAELNSYISQTRVYEQYFDDPNNRSWFEKKYGFKVLHPKRTIIVGRRWHFNQSEWREILSDFKNIDILTYDDLIDGVTAQLYL